MIEKFTLKAKIPPIAEDIKIYVAISMGRKIIGAITRKNIECEFIEKINNKFACLITINLLFKFETLIFTYSFYGLFFKSYRIKFIK